MCDNWEETATMFTKLFQRPKMQEKLLCKPPFRYIFDIIIATSDNTQFAKGLFPNNECDAKYYDDKDKKLLFLQKVKDITQLVQRTEYEAKPTKIAAGLEPQHTNALLQAYYTSATTCKDSTPYVKKVLKKHGQLEETQEEEKPQSRQQPKPAQQQQQQQEEEVTKKPEVAKAHKKKVQERQEKEEEEEDLKPKNIRQENVDLDTKGRGAFLQNNMDDNLDLDNQTDQKEEQSAPSGQGIKLRKKLGKNPQKNEPTSAQPGQGGQVLKKKGTIEIPDNLNDVNALKQLVQSISQNANPLGKSLEFIQDDIESMNQELKHWNKQYQGAKDKMQREIRVTEDTLSGVQDKITEIELCISDEKAKIQNMKFQIIKNQYTIQTLLHSVVATK